MESAYDRGPAFLGLLLQHFNHAVSVLTVKSTSWLIQENQVRICNQLNSQGSSLTFLSRDTGESEKPSHDLIGVLFQVK